MIDAAKSPSGVTDAVCAAPTIDAFEAGDFDVASFDHAAHLFVAWQYLCRWPLDESIRRFRGALPRLTRKLGIADKYHETITLFYLYEMAERMPAPDNDMGETDWPVFVAANPDLFDKAPPLISRRYSPERLGSAMARRQFLLPDRPVA